MFCEKCGALVNENDKFCQKCGAEVTLKKTDIEEMSDISLKKSNNNRKPIIIVAISLIMIFLIISMTKGGTNKYVNIVKNGTISYYPEVTVGEAFKNWFSSPKWSYDSATELVDFTGNCTWKDRTAKAVIEFRVYDDNSFEPYSTRIEDKYETTYFTEMQSLEMYIDIFDDAYISKGLEPPSELRDTVNATYFLNWIFN